MGLIHFLKFSLKFHNYKSLNAEGKLCFWLVFPFSYTKYLYIMNFDTASLKSQAVFKEYEKSR